MKRISTNLSGLAAEKRSHFDAIVVGSGYGGGVSALRLAQSGRAVCVLERGREILPGEYPDTPQKAAKEIQVATAQEGPLSESNGLFDIRVHEDMSVVIGCGLGGTSLINANVALEPDARVLRSHRWPDVFKKPDTLKPYFEKAREELASTPLPERYYPNKLKALEVSAEGMGLKAERPPINVTFKDNTDPLTGVVHRACTMCGDCVSGCNFGAKNTTLMNYLPRAHAYGATIVTEAAVHHIARDGDRWQVIVEDRRPSMHDPDDDTPPSTTILTADTVVLAAGSLGSTEILYRSRNKGLSLSDQLGRKFSGNGDVLGFGFDAFWNNKENNGDDPQLPLYGIGAGNNRPDIPQFQPGPCITGVIKVNMDDESDYRRGMVIEEGVAPGAISMVMPLGLFMQQALNGDFTRFPDVEERLRGAEAIGQIFSGEGEMDFSDLPYKGPAAQTQTFLVMSHDDARGRLEMNVDTDKIVVHWPEVGEQPNYHEVNEKLQDASDSIWANYLPNPLWRPRFGRKLVTVHPVGGCPMGNTARQGVVNDACQVYSGTKGTDVHDGLYVCDGAVIPSSVGLNPLLTITAVSERAMDILVRETPSEKVDLLRSGPQCVAVAPILEDETPEPPITEKIHDIITMFKGWIALIDAGDYPTARSEIRNKVMGYFDDSESPEIHKKLLTNIKSRILALGLDVGLTKGELVSDIAPALTYVTKILEGVYDRVEQEDYMGAAKFLEDECGDFSPDLAFSETMRGFVSRPLETQTQTLSDAYEIAAKYGEANENRIRGDFRIVADSLKKLTDLDAHEANLTGEITCPLITDAPMIIQDDGKFHCLIAQEGEVETWKMIYACVTRANGRDYYFHGFKTLARRPGSNWWTDLTTLSVDIYEGDKPNKNRLIAKGVMTLGVQDLLKQLSTVSSEFPSQEDNTILTTLTADALLWGDLNNDLKDPKRREKLLRKLVGLLALAKHSQLTSLVSLYFLGKFGAFFGMLVFRAYGEMLAYLFNFPGRAMLEGKVTPLPDLDGSGLRYMSNVYAQSHPVKTKSGVELHLTRYDARLNKQDRRRTVILAPGFATRAASFAMETVDRNLVDCLCAEGYDVWLFDYRSSPLLAASLKTFTLDDIATEDWPAAVEYIQKTAEVNDMQAIVHCMGSMTHLMALTTGLKGIRSVVSSQLTLHPVTNWFNKFKADTYMARMIRDGLPSNLLPMADTLAPNKEVANLFRGLKTIDSNSQVIENPDDREKFLQDQVINMMTWEVPFPNDAHCYSPTCHRIFGLYGPVFAHEQLNEKTHNAIQTVFGAVSTRPFQQIAEVVRQGMAVDKDGKNVYLKHKELRLPITFLAGALNQEFMPDTSLRTYKWLKERNADVVRYYDRKVFQEYAHMDFFLGKNADLDIYPTIIEALRSHDEILQKESQLT